MRRIRVERHVRDDDEVRVLRLDRPDGALHEAFGVGTFGTVEALVFLVDDRKQRNRGDPEVDRLRKLFEQQVNALSLDARHRRHRLGAFFTIENENGVN